MLEQRDLIDRGFKDDDHAGDGDRSQGDDNVSLGLEVSMMLAYGC